jgi:hypothetical protein
MPFVASFSVDCQVFNPVASDVNDVINEEYRRQIWHLLILDRLLWFTRVDAFSAYMTGMSPSLDGWGMGLMDIDVLHSCDYSHIAIIQLGQSIAWL